MKIIKRYAGLEYVELKIKNGRLSAEAAIEIELEIAKAILRYKPLRGKEILFIRKQLQLSCAKLSLKLGGAFDASTISRWETRPDDRLSPSNEIHIRVILSELLNVKIKANRDNLIPEIDDEKLEFAA